jgi:hypothetical protein
VVPCGVSWLFEGQPCCRRGRASIVRKLTLGLVETTSNVARWDRQEEVSVLWSSQRMYRFTGSYALSHCVESFRTSVVVDEISSNEIRG